ncbi:probable rRNA maturation factor [Caminicella sporogenes DSM 14501]|uniref:Endoribonuclease YbeY n=1 Tax=Caminicella sporogenes DSM 14501 TaxID=1121266 RepID=A0A1M6MBG5_9FIRM|nr:rRNA maturation RNase YbeY [Caminicella sporogenes]RKD27617.1 rRNA maturation RNase YbeY [Caminicella sporogenes]SHJ80822.1 probable rRNA maturation factor [Caminicella sporogenes DSM 14501]
MDVIVDNRQNKIQLNDKLINLVKKVVEKCLNEEGIKQDVEISISFVDNNEIRELNKNFRDKDTKTDVLSFPQYDNIEMIKSLDTKIILGDIVISLEKAREQSVEYGHTFEREVAFLTAHSMYHLFGFDHDTEENTKIMRQKEEKVLKDLGILR